MQLSWSPITICQVSQDTCCCSVLQSLEVVVMQSTTIRVPTPSMGAWLQAPCAWQFPHSAPPRCAEELQHRQYDRISHQGGLKCSPSHSSPMHSCANRVSTADRQRRTLVPHGKSATALTSSSARIAMLKRMQTGLTCGSCLSVRAP